MEIIRRCLYLATERIMSTQITGLGLQKAELELWNVMSMN